MILANFFVDQYLHYVYNLILVTNIVVSIVNSFLFPLYILLTVRKNFPDFYSNRNKIWPLKSKISYMTTNSFEPWRPSVPVQVIERNVNYGVFITVREYDNSVM